MHHKTVRIPRRFHPKNHIKRLTFNKNWNPNVLHVLPAPSAPSRYHFSEKHHAQNTNNEYNNFNKTNLLFPIVGVAIGAMTISAVLLKSYYAEHHTDDTDHTVMNYSGTHSATPTYYFQPNSVSEVENLVQLCNKRKLKLRAMGSGISPNGISHSNTAIMDMGHCNKILHIDADKKQITVEAGTTIKAILSAITPAPYNMTLENIPSILEQQIGGLTQVSSHGTGIDIGPCDMQIIAMTVITPSGGKIELTQDDDLFYWARVGLGTLGIVTQVTLQCVDRHKLSEYLWIMDVDELMLRRNELLNRYKHVKFLWVPYMNNKAVVIASNPIDDAHFEAMYHASHTANDSELEIKCQQPMRELLCSKTGEKVSGLNEHLSFADLRDLLLGYDDSKYILDTNWIKEINESEFKYWNNLSENKEAQQIDFSENVLSFQCGGQQWVYEICFPIKKCYKSDEIPMDIQFAKDLLSEIEENDIAAPSPLEQRFTAPSSSYLSPAYGSKHDGDDNDAFCWFGIIFYIPTSDEQKRRWISNEFQRYSRILDELSDKYGAVGHWAKVETYYLNKNDRLKLQERIKNRFGEKLNEYFKIRNKYDPNNILINDVVSDFFNI